MNQGAAMHNKPLLKLFLFLLAASAASAVYSMGNQQYLLAMAARHAHDAPVASPAALQKPAQPVRGINVVYANVDGKPVHGYFSVPLDHKGALPGIIVIHEWWGLNDNIRSMADQLAGQGYAALAVDLYGGKTAKDPA